MDGAVPGLAEPDGGVALEERHLQVDAREPRVPEGVGGHAEGQLTQDPPYQMARHGGYGPALIPVVSVAVVGVQEELLRVRRDLLKDTLNYFREMAKGDAKEGRCTTDATLGCAAPGPGH